MQRGWWASQWRAMLGTDLTFYIQDPKFHQEGFPHSVLAWAEWHDIHNIWSWMSPGMAQGHLSSDLSLVLSGPTVPSVSPYCPSQGHIRVFHTGAAEAGLAEPAGGSPGVQGSWCFEEQTGAGAGLGAGSASFKQQLGFWHSAAAGTTLAKTNQTRAKWAANPIISFGNGGGYGGGVVGGGYEARIFRRIFTRVEPPANPSSPSSFTLISNIYIRGLACTPQTCQLLNSTPPPPTPTLVTITVGPWARQLTPNQTPWAPNGCLGWVKIRNDFNFMWQHH